MIFTVSNKDNLIQLREFDIDINPYYRHEFMEFAEETYSTIQKVWIHEDIEFTAFIESGTWRVIGLLVAVPNFGIRQVHIRFLAVAEDYRHMGLGTKLLALIANKYRRLEITLNIELDRLDLLDFYCKKSYAVQKEVVKEQNIMILSLVHINVLAKIVLG